MNSRMRQDDGGGRTIRTVWAMRLAAWLAEREIDEALRETPEPSPVPPAPVCGGRGRVGVGQIRLLHPAAVPEADRPFYVAVLEARGPGLLLIAPFSRFAQPATEGEWVTGRKAKPLRVLCVWNARAVPVSLLRSGWAAGRLTAAERQAALTLRRCLRGEAEPRAALLRRTGPPIVHPRDPRQSYVAEEGAAMDSLAVEPMETPGGPGESGDPLSYEEPEPPSLLRAAEPDVPYGGAGRSKRRSDRPTVAEPRRRQEAPDASGDAPRQGR